MALVRLTPLAREDLDEIWRYIALDNVAAADRQIDLIESLCGKRAHHPMLGQRRMEFGEGDYRSFLAGSYVVYYIPIEDGILVVRVLHGARDHGPLLP